jgi:hypothetical protein
MKDKSKVFSIVRKLRQVTIIPRRIGCTQEIISFSSYRYQTLTESAMSAAAKRSALRKASTAQIYKDL